jgi:transposase
MTQITKKNTMTYSLDLRERVVRYVNNGGSKASAARKFEVSIWCVNDWCCRENLEPKKHGRRQRKLDREALKKDVRRYPDKLLRERAATFDVCISTIVYALSQMNITHKKNI